MKRFTIFLLCVALLLCVCGCFKSKSKEETSAASDAAQATTTAATTAVPTTTSAPLASVGYVDTGSSDTLNVRPQPNTLKDPVGGLENGVQVKIIGEEGDFYKIEFHDLTGAYTEDFAYVSKQYITVAGGTTTAATAATTTAAATAATTAIGSTPTQQTTAKPAA